MARRIELRLAQGGRVAWAAPDGRLTAAWCREGMHALSRLQGRSIHEWTWEELCRMPEEYLEGVCSACGRHGDGVRWARFAAWLCPDCYAEYERRVREEARRGDVCRICGAPRSACAC